MSYTVLTPGFVRNEVAKGQFNLGLDPDTAKDFHDETLQPAQALSLAPA